MAFNEYVTNVLFDANVSLVTGLERDVPWPLAASSDHVPREGAAVNDPLLVKPMRGEVGLVRRVVLLG